MGAVVGLLFGLGVLLIWRSGPRAPQHSGVRLGQRRVELLHQAGVRGVGPAQLLGAQVLCALVAAGAVLLLTRTITVTVCFGVFAFFVPVVVLRRMRRRRQVALREIWPEAVDNLASAVRAGMSLAEGLSALGDRGPDRVARAVRTVRDGLSGQRSVR